MTDAPNASTFSRNQVTTTQAILKRKVELPASQLSTKKKFMSSPHMSNCSRTTNSVSPRGKPSSRANTHRLLSRQRQPSAHRIEKKKPFRLCSPTWLIIRPAGLRSDSHCGTEGCCNLQHRKFPIQSDFGGQESKTRFSSAPRGMANFGICVEVGRESLRLCVRLSLPVWADAYCLN